MHIHALAYSTHEKITLNQLKSNPDLSTLDTSMIQKKVTENNINAMVYGEKTYHPKFLPIKQTPYIIYTRGNTELLHQPLLGIVGPRLMSPYASSVLKKLFGQIKNYRLSTISGFAEGVDTVCHQLSHEHNIPTIAVLGKGLLTEMRSSKRQKLQKIVDNGGLIISEFRLNETGGKRSFPQRNRLIAGLSECVFLPEAKQKSGSFITVDRANQMNIPVYATPNTRNSETSKGVHQAMAEGKVKTLIDFPVMLNKHFGIPEKTSTQTTNLTDTQTTIIEHINNNHNTLEKLQQHTKISISELITQLSIMEIQGLVDQHTPGVYISI